MAKLPGTNVALTFLEINGKGAGLIRDFKPPTYEVETINPGLAATGGVKRAFGSPKISKAVVTFPISQTGPLFDWAAAFMRKEVVETDLAIIMADQNYQARLRVDLLRCLITEIAFPPLEGGSKDPFEVTVTFQPNGIKYSKAGGRVDTSSMPKNKAWTISNFRLTTPGIDGKYVSRVDLPTLSLRISKESVGEVRPPERHTSWEIGGLKTEHSSLGFDAALDLVTRTLQDGVISESESMDISVDMYRRVDGNRRRHVYIDRLRSTEARLVGRGSGENGHRTGRVRRGRLRLREAGAGSGSARADGPSAEQNVLAALSSSPS